MLSVIQKIHKYLADDIEAMNGIIADNLSADEELITLVGSHLANSGGKRLRPVLAILSARLFGYRGENILRLATSVEFIHMATLLHDDVVDDSKMRRFLPSANVIWGNNASILVGDFLFSQAFKLMVSTKIMPALEVLSSTSAIIIEGEVSQLVQLEQKKSLNEADYLKIINAKTAALFGASCEVGAIVADKLEYAARLKEFGMCLGVVFQIADDALDYFSESEKVGKNIGDDFFEGKITLPLILLEQKISTQDQQKLKATLQQKVRTKDELIWVQNLMKEHDIQSAIASYLEKPVKKTYDALEKINIENQCKEYMKEMVEFAISRTY